MDFTTAISTGFKKYATFKGTASRSEYWYWALFTFLLGLVAAVLDSLNDSSTVASLISIATLLPSLAVQVRRLRDAGYRWQWMLSPIPGLLAFIAGVVMAVVAVANGGYLDNPLVQNDPNLIGKSPIIDQLMADSLFVGGLITVLFSLLLLFVATVIVSIIFMVQPSKTAEQGNKRLIGKD